MLFKTVGNNRCSTGYELGERCISRSQQITGSSNLDITHSNPWQRLSRYEMGDLVKHNGSLWESQIDANFNRVPGGEGDYWKEIPSNYAVEREDWNLETTAIENRIYFLSPDGRLF